MGTYEDLLNPPTTGSRKAKAAPAATQPAKEQQPSTQQPAAAQTPAPTAATPKTDAAATGQAATPPPATAQTTAPAATTQQPAAGQTTTPPATTGQTAATQPATQQQQQTPPITFKPEPSDGTEAEKEQRELEIKDTGKPSETEQRKPQTAEELKAAIERGENPQLSNVEMFRILNSDGKSAEDKKKDEKKAKRDRMFAAINDGIAALSNLYFTTQGAPNAYKPRETNSERVRAYQERLEKERTADKAAYNAGLMRAMAADKVNKDADREWKRKLGLDEDERKRKDAEQKRKDALAGAQAGKYKAAADKDGAMQAYYEAKENAIYQGIPLDLAEKRAKTAYYNKKASESGSSGGRYTLYNDKTGKTESYKTKGEWERRAGELGYPVSAGDSETHTETDMMGTTKDQTRKSGTTVEGRIGQEEARRKAAARNKAAGKPSGKATTMSNVKKLGL